MLPRVVVVFWHILVVPVKEPGVLVTVATIVREQPVVAVYTIPVVPVATPVTTPVPLTVAVDGLALFQVPPVGLPASATVLPAHITGVPAMVGRAITVTTAVLRQPPASVYDMVVVPALTPVTTPLVLMVAVPVAELVQVPPVVALPRLVVLPMQVVSVPVIGVIEPTVNTALLVQPVVAVTEMVVVPAVRAVTTPVAEIVATDGVELLHDDAAGLLATLAVVPPHADSVPPMVGVALIVTIIDFVQPVGAVYTTFVVPATRPVITPVDGAAVPTKVLLLLHVPPVTVLLSVVLVAGHALAVPVMAGNAAFTVTITVARLPDTL
jgi:hypothetical protein